jgi:hypothetical protein
VSFIDEMMVDESETLTDEDKAALDAEERGETYEPEPEVPLELVEEKRELARQLAEERERFARLDERRIAREEAEAPNRQQAPAGPPSKLGPRPDDYLDPIGADLWDANRRTEMLEQRFEEQQRAAEQNEFARWVENDATSFKAQHPDYEQAAARAYQFRVDYWTKLGLPEAHARVIVDRESYASAVVSRVNGKSAAEGFYELGKRLLASKGAPARQRQPAPMRGKPQARRAVDIDAMSESQLENEIRRNPRGITGAIERLELGR